MGDRIREAAADPVRQRVAEDGACDAGSEHLAEADHAGGDQRTQPEQHHRRRHQQAHDRERFKEDDDERGRYGPCRVLAHEVDRDAAKIIEDGNNRTSLHCRRHHTGPAYPWSSGTFIAENRDRLRVIIAFSQPARGAGRRRRDRRSGHRQPRRDPAGRRGCARPAAIRSSAATCSPCKVRRMQAAGGQPADQQGCRARPETVALVEGHPGGRMTGVQC